MTTPMEVEDRPGERTLGSVQAPRQQLQRPPMQIWELSTDEGYASWLKAERRLRHQRYMLPLE